jgi:type I restriction enzyme, S subunit
LSSELPRGWALAKIPDLIGANGVFSDGDWVESEDQDPNGDVRLIQLADVGDGAYVNKSNRFLTKSKARELHCTFLRAGDVLVARMPDPLGRACIFPGDNKDAVTVVDVCVIRGEQDHVDQQWLMHFINSPELRAEIHALQSGSTRRRISRGNLSTIPLRVPPRAEQTRIVEKLEELLSDLDAGVAELKVAQRKLAQYRQSLLKAAVEGALTADWRAAHDNPQETGAELLQRILSERRARWEQKQLAKFAKQGKTPPKGWQAKCPEPANLDLTNLPPLPEGWVWASIDQLSPDDLANGRSVPTAEVGAKVLRLTAVREGRIDLGEWKYGAWSEEEAQQFSVVEGDLLIVRGNGSLALVGRAGLVGPVRDQVAYPDTLIRLRTLNTIVRPTWISLVWDSDRSRAHLERRARTSAGIYKISQPDIVSVAVPVPPLAEQDRILEEFESHREQIASTTQVLVAGLKQAAAQRKNILKAAFAGQLVPQDPNDEPASELLVRIRGECDSNEDGAPGRRRKTV